MFLDWLIEHVRSFTGWSETRKVAALKALLSDFNARTGTWKQS
jgi:hypothetical protein